MNARFSFALIVIASALVSGCAVYPYNGGYAGTDNLMTWAQGAGGITKHERKVRCSTYGCRVSESASSRNIRYGVPPAVSGGPVVYIEKGQPDVMPTPAPNPYPVK